MRARRIWKAARSIIVLAIAGVGGHVGVNAGPASTVDDVVVPELSTAAKTGELSYVEHCAQCHGVNAAGTDEGPTFIHRVYHPGHHTDDVFLLAVKRGVRAHHWRLEAIWRR